MAKEKLEKGDFKGLAAPARRALARAGHTKLSDLTKVTEAQLARLHGIGPNAISALRKKLTAIGHSFKK